VAPPCFLPPPFPPSLFFFFFPGSGPSDGREEKEGTSALRFRALRTAKTPTPTPPPPPPPQKSGKIYFSADYPSFFSPPFFFFLPFFFFFSFRGTLGTIDGWSASGSWNSEPRFPSSFSFSFFPFFPAARGRETDGSGAEVRKSPLDWYSFVFPPSPLFPSPPPLSFFLFSPGKGDIEGKVEKHCTACAKQVSGIVSPFFPSPPLFSLKERPGGEVARKREPKGSATDAAANVQGISSFSSPLFLLPFFPCHANCDTRKRASVIRLPEEPGASMPPLFFSPSPSFLFLSPLRRPRLDASPERERGANSRGSPFSLSSSLSLPPPLLELHLRRYGRGTK